MSFGTYARTVRDGSEPYGRRINALAGWQKANQSLWILHQIANATA